MFLWLTSSARVLKVPSVLKSQTKYFVCESGQKCPPLLSVKWKTCVLQKGSE